MNTQDTDLIERDVEELKRECNRYWAGNTDSGQVVLEVPDYFLQDWLRSTITRIQQETERRVLQEIVEWCEEPLKDKESVRAKTIDDLIIYLSNHV